MFGGLRLDPDPQRVKFRVVVEMSPLIDDFVEDDRPFAFGRDDEKVVAPR
jgi:hypothetical protein